MGKAIGLLNGKPCRAVDGVGQLIDNVSSNEWCVGQLGLWEVLHKLRDEGVGPDGTGDSSSNRTTNSSRDIQSSERSSDILVGNGSKDSKLHDQDEDSSTDGNKDLAHNDVSDVLVRSAEVDHETKGKDVDRNRKVKSPFVEASLSDEEADDEEKNARDDLESRVDVASFSRAEVDDDLQE